MEPSMEPLVVAVMESDITFAVIPFTAEESSHPFKRRIGFVAPIILIATVLLMNLRLKF